MKIKIPKEFRSYFILDGGNKEVYLLECSKIKIIFVNREYYIRKRKLESSNSLIRINLKKGDFIGRLFLGKIKIPDYYAERIGDFKNEDFSFKFDDEKLILQRKNLDNSMVYELLYDIIKKYDEPSKD